jgi:hypothetical protein
MVRTIVSEVGPACSEPDQRTGCAACSVAGTGADPGADVGADAGTAVGAAGVTGVAGGLASAAVLVKINATIDIARIVMVLLT